MASSCFVICVFLAVWIVPRRANCFVAMQCSRRSVGQHGHQSMLMCVIKPTEDTTDVTVRVVSWKKGDHCPLNFEEGEETIDPGYSFAESSWNEKNLNVSLLIVNTKVEHDGDYTCEVVTDSGLANGKTTLKVTARYSSPTVKLIKEGKTLKALHCNATGGYPMGTLRWFDKDGTNWTKSATLVQTKTSDGLYNLSSELLLSPNSIFPEYTCMVFNASGGKEEAASVITAEALGGPEELISQSSKVVAPLVVIGSLIVGLLALLLYRRRSQQLRRPSTTPLMGPGQEIPAQEQEDDEDDSSLGEDEKNTDNIV